MNKTSRPTRSRYLASVALAKQTGRWTLALPKPAHRLIDPNTKKFSSLESLLAASLDAAKKGI